jgi:nucleoside-diphosphate-sugar epimerase
VRVLILGVGYLGLPLGKALAAQGHEVFGVQRSAEAQDALKAAGITPLVADITDPESLQCLLVLFDWVVNCVSSSKGGADVYRKIFLHGARHLIQWLAPTPPKKFVFISSTSVYGQTDGSLVKEDSPTEPASETSKILVEAEKMWLEAARAKEVPAMVLRLAGIYGPGRGHPFQQFLKGEARIHGDGVRLMNMIHVDDAVGAILAALKHGRPGEIYNVVDDEPVTERHFFHWLSQELGKWMPPQASEAELAGRKRGVTNKKVSNRRLKMELGYKFRFPTYRVGYTAEIKRLEDAGELDLTPEPR